MASVWDIKITEALLVLCLAYYVVKQVQHCWNWDGMAFTYGDMVRTFHEYILRIFCNGCSLVTQTHSSHASERVWWTPASDLAQPIPRIWGALILHWLVVNNYTRGDDCCYYVTRPPLSPFKIKYQFLRNTLDYIADIHCRLLITPKRDRENQFWYITFEITCSNIMKPSDC